MVSNLCRSRVIEHTKGYAIQTPLLLPSYSSIGVSKIFDNNEEKYKLNTLYSILSKEINKEHLISAYDIYYNYLDVQNIGENNYLVVDSGGYELRYKINARKLKEIHFSEDQYIDIIKNNWSKHTINFVTFDHDYWGFSVKQQLERSQRTLDTIHNINQTCTMLIKPSSNSMIDISDVIININGLKGYDVLGVTERELGLTIAEKVINIRKIRTALDENNIDIPIHIFGCLEPIWIILFYISGAEIFDGLNWMSNCYWKEGFVRFQDALLINKNCYTTVTDDFVNIIDRNIQVLDELQNTLVRYFHTSEYKLFDKYGINYDELFEHIKEI